MIEIGDLVFPEHYGPEALGVVCDLYEPREGRRNTLAKVLMKNGQSYSFVVNELKVHTKKNDKLTVKRK